MIQPPESGSSPEEESRPPETRPRASGGGPGPGGRASEPRARSLRGTRGAPADEEASQFEDYPLTRSEYISAMVHFYRGELTRADDWRARLDPTTNWAIITAAAMLSFSFNSPAHSHVTLLLALILVTIFLAFEARRFRYFDVWRSRVRMFEENFWIPMIRRDLVSPRPDWREAISQDLDRPTFKLSFLEAVGIRLRYNYLWIYLALVAAWVAKLNIHPTPARSFSQVVRRMAIGPVGGRAVLGIVALTFLGALALAVRAGHERAAVDEIRGLEKSVEAWKT